MIPNNNIKITKPCYLRFIKLMSCNNNRNISKGRYRVNKVKVLNLQRYVPYSRRKLAKILAKIKKIATEDFIGILCTLGSI